MSAGDYNRGTGEDKFDGERNVIYADSGEGNRWPRLV